MQPTLGIVGGGQLARMTQQAASVLGIDVRILASPGDEAVGPFADVTVAALDDLSAATAFAARCDVVTFDREPADPALASALAAGGARVLPDPSTLAVAADKLETRRVLAAARVPVPPFVPVGSLDDVCRATRDFGTPLVLKAARGGYDGRGVWLVEHEREIQAALATGLPLLAEPVLSLARELAVVVVRSRDGAMRTYPVVETVQVDGMCREVLAPAPIPPSMAAAATALARRVADLVGAVGILAVELFVVGDDLVVNELAPRPHNSGHWTIDGAATSQFENHLRAVLDLPLGSTDATARAVAMANVVGHEGDPRNRLADALALGPVRVHLYGKTPRPGRKIGHVTVTGHDLHEVRALATRAAGVLAGHTAEVAR